MLFQKRSVTTKRILIALLFVSNIFILFQYLAYTNTSQIDLPNQFNNSDLCPIVSPNLVGQFVPDIAEETLEAVEYRYQGVLRSGGYFSPPECQSRDRVAVIVTCRGRENQIPIFLKNIHAMMMRQQIEYQIYIVFQTHGFWFNQGALYNVGYVEALKERHWDCFILHDVDDIPMDDRNIYNCPRANPRHMAVDVEKYNHTLPHSDYFGGVKAFTTEQYRTVNGHSNQFWGRNNVDDDIYNRVKYAGYLIERYPYNVTKYKSLIQKLPFKHQRVIRQRNGGKERFVIDGLNSLKYHILEKEKKNTFTRILVHLIPEEMGRNSNEVREQHLFK